MGPENEARRPANIWEASQATAGDGSWLRASLEPQAHWQASWLRSNLLRLLIRLQHSGAHHKATAAWSRGRAIDKSRLRRRDSKQGLAQVLCTEYGVYPTNLLPALPGDGFC